jgi:GTP-binding protein
LGAAPVGGAALAAFFSILGAVKVSRAEFMAAASSPGQIPPARTPEVALAGRSNVGKSSLINRLTGRRKLARTSQTPGCTRGLNFYGIDDRLTLVDLPGYGWARRSKEERTKWKALVEYYLENRSELAGVLILTDARRGPEEEERMLADYLTGAAIPHAWVLTKSDKLGRSELAARVREIAGGLDGARPFATSAHSGRGMDELWAWIDGAAREHRGKRRA